MFPLRTWVQAKQCQTQLGSEEQLCWYKTLYSVSFTGRRRWLEEGFMIFHSEWQSEEAKFLEACIVGDLSWVIFTCYWKRYLLLFDDLWYRVPTGVGFVRRNNSLREACFVGDFGWLISTCSGLCFLRYFFLFKSASNINLKSTQCSFWTLLCFVIFFCK